MKFDCSKDNLINALSLVSRGVANKTTMPILEGILFQVYDNQLFLTSTNLEISIQTAIPAHTEQDGEVILQSNFISELVRKLSGDDVFFELLDHYQLKMDCQLSSFTIKGLPTREFPEFPEVIDDYNFVIESSELKSLIHGTIFAVAVKENIPVLTGLKLEMEDDRITMIALDGYRLALRRGKLKEAINEPISIIIPGKSMSELDKLLSNVNGDVQVHLSKTQIFFEMGVTQFTSRLLEGEFINYKHIIPSEKNTEIVIERRLLLESAERAALLARVGKNNLIKMEIGIDQLTLSSNADIGDVKEVIPIEKTGDELRIAFNSKFVIDALRVLNQDKILIDMTTPVGPAVILSDDDSFIYLILPVRVSE
ncbi:MAG: DNA polymerase III subunit beta [Eubacteriaceae bacterium]|nr:DNA polymerase III subunit beta [Eubacteriaceae bacterium]MDD4507500.1 DNA polymerase III subunit beta [Eubacteriaceae bacterium]